MTLKYRMRITGAITIAAILLCVGVASAKVRQKKLLLNASGSTFIFPIESAWANVYQRANRQVRINYQPIGSGGGIGQLMQQMIDFAGSDAPLTDEQLAKAPGKILHFPAALGADVVVYNLPKIVPQVRLRLTGPVVADIFRGKITKWNDPAISGLNPALKLPDLNIVACHGAEGSGTTYIFTDYLSKVSPDWEKEIGKGTSVKWPVGPQGNGNQAVTDLLTHTPGAIAYIEQNYAMQANLAIAQIQNSAGQWVDPDIKSITIAANDSMNNFPADFRGSITNAPGAGAYPISSYTYFLVYAHPKNPAKAAATRDFLDWVLRDGQTYSMQLHYAPLPDAVVEREEAQLDLIAPPAQARAR